MYGLDDPEEILEETKNRLGRIPTVPGITTKDLEEPDDLKKLQKRLSALRKKASQKCMCLSSLPCPRKLTVHR